MSSKIYTGLIWLESQASVVSQRLQDRPGLLAVVSKLIGDLGGTPTPQASSEAIGNLKVFSLPAGTLPWKAAVHYARDRPV